TLEERRHGGRFGREVRYPLQVVDDLEQAAHQLPLGAGSILRPLLFGSLAIIVELGGESTVAVTQLLQLRVPASVSAGIGARRPGPFLGRRAHLVATRGWRLSLFGLRRRGGGGAVRLARRRLRRTLLLGSITSHFNRGLVGKQVKRRHPGGLRPPVYRRRSLARQGARRVPYETAKTAESSRQLLLDPVGDLPDDLLATTLVKRLVKGLGIFDDLAGSAEAAGDLSRC